MNPTPNLPYHFDFQVGGGVPVQFAGMTKGSVTSVVPGTNGTYRYTPFMAALGVDNFSATYQPTYGGYPGYNPPPTTTLIPMTINFPSYGATMDESYANPDPATSTDYPTINYFALKDNTLTITPDKGVLKNDTTAPFVSYLTAHQVGNGQYGTFNIQPNGGFTYTPYSSVFTASFNGLTDTCQYYPQAPDGTTRPAGVVKVDLARVYITRNALSVYDNPELLDVWVGQKVGISVSVDGEVPLGLSVFQWDISGLVVDGYTGYGGTEGIDPGATYFLNSTDPDGASHGQVIDFSSQELSQQYVSFYWVDGGVKSTSIAVGCLGQVGSDFAQFDVDAPISQLSGTTTSVTKKEEADGSITLNFGTYNGNGEAGIYFNRTQDSAAEQVGSFRLTQIVTLDRFSAVRTLGGSVETFRDDNGVDMNPRYPYEEDAPRFRVKSSWYFFSREFSAKTYLMYRHSSYVSIWVPVQVMSWGFVAALTKDTTTGDWTLSSIITPSNPVGVCTTEFPEWSRILTGGTNIDPDELSWESPT